MPQICPSILTADFLNLGKVIEMLNQSEADMIHLDIMDGNFVPNLTFGFPVIKQIQSRASKPLDVHLMISNAESYIGEYRDAGADSLTVHWEACTHIHRTIQKIKDMGMKAAISLNPSTPVDLLRDILPDLDMVLIMTVNPGFGGQKFIPQSYGKIRKLKAIISEMELSTLIQIDGGVNTENIRPLADAGVDLFVVGNTIFAADDPLGMIRKLKKA